MISNQTPEGFFYGERDLMTCAAAEKILRILFAEFGISNNVVDVGCGVGTWLKAASDLGSKNVYGFEGTWAKENKFVIPENHVTYVDLEDSWEIQEKFDLAVCLEVAEHLSEASGKRLIKKISESADMVLFSAAIPGQGGNEHVNEQWPDYWQNLFRDEGFLSVDLIRPKIIRDVDIPWWYRQNIFLAAKKGILVDYLEKKHEDGISMDLLGFQISQPQPKHLQNCGCNQGIRGAIQNLIREVKKRLVL